MKKIIITLAILAAVGISVIVIVSHMSRDIPDPDVSDLAVERLEIAEENNAYTYFSSATNSFNWPTSSAVITDYLDGQSVDSDILAEIIASNEKTLAFINQGIERQICITPEIYGYETLSPYLLPWLNIGRVLAAKARFERLAGRYTDAAETCISLLRFADLIQQDPECIIHYLVGLAVLETGLTQAEGLARDTGTPASELRRILPVLNDLGPFAPGLVRAVKLEYGIIANTIDGVLEGKFNMGELTSLSGTAVSSMLKGKHIPGYFFQPNKTKLTFASIYRDMIRNAALCYVEMNLYGFVDHLRLDDSRFKLITRPNVVGRMLYAVLIPSFNSIMERKCRAECGVAGIRLLVAISICEKEKGRSSATLDAIIPLYMAAIPEDPYDGRPFRCDFQNGIIYSVGKDLKDSGGSSDILSGGTGNSLRRSRWDAEDIVFSIREEIECAAEVLAAEGETSEAND